MSGHTALPGQSAPASEAPLSLAAPPASSASGSPVALPALPPPVTPLEGSAEQGTRSTAPASGRSDANSGETDRAGAQLVSSGREHSEQSQPRIEVAQAQQAQSPATRPPPQQQVPPGRQPAQIDRNNLLFLVRSTLLALHQANETGNYSVLREMSAPGFQSANNPARLAEIFANLRAQKLDLAPVSILEPQITATPTVDSNNLLLVEGAYPNIPPHVSFRLLFQPVEGRWRLEGISINLGQGAVAQQQPAPAPSQAAPTRQPTSAPRSNAPRQ